MTLQSKSVSIAGGGVAGLAAASAFARAGAEVTLYERAPAIAEVGAGLQISPNGRRALSVLGLNDALTAVSVPSQGTRLIDGLSNTEIVFLPPQKGAVFVHRPRLIEVLLRGAADVGAEIVTSAEVSPDALDGDLILGADGFRSRFRAALNSGEEPKYSGQVAWRAVIEDPSTPPVAEVYLGPGRHLVTYPMGNGLRNIVACEDRRDWTAEGWAIEDRPQNLRAAFARFPDHVQGWLAKVETLNLWGLFLHPVAQHWTDGRLALLGDAAHPTLPYLAQGANLALEDAVVLARAVARGDLSAYEAHRRTRAQAVVAAATANAGRFHLSNPLVRQAGFAALKLREKVLPGAAARSFAWVWDYDAATAPI